MNPARILIVEDEGVVVRDVRTLLAELGYEVVGDTTLGEQSIVLAGQLRPSLVLMDIHLAGAVDGIAAARAIRDQFAIPVVFLTAFAGDDTLERAKLAEPLGYVLKPFEDRELRTAIELALFKHAAERQLRERDAEQESILRTALDGFWVVDTAGQILKVNDAYCRMVGYPREELLHLTVADLEVTESPDQVTAHSEQVRATGHACFESRHRHRDGHFVDLEISVNFLPGGGGRFFAFLRDITERKRAQAALRQKEIEYRSLIENLASGLVVHGPDSAVRLNNPRAAELLGLTADQMRGKTAVDPAWQFLRADGTPAPLADYPVNRVLATGEPLKGFVLGIRRPDRAAPVWVLCDAYPVREPGGPIAEVVVTFADITARKLAEEQAQALLAEAEKSRGVLLSLLEDQHQAGESLRQSEEKFSLAFKTSPYAITLTRVADGRLLEVNEAFVTLSGFSRKAALAQADLGATFWAHPEDWEEVVADLAQGQEVIAREYPFRRQTGEERAGLCSARTLQLGGEPCILASVNDITERKQSEQALRFTQFAMENAAEAIFWFTPEGRIEYANGAARRLLGYTEEEMLCLAITDVAEELPIADCGLRIADSQSAILNPQSAIDWPAHWAALKQARSMCFEARHRTKDGRSVPVEIQANFMALGDREYDCGFVRDISERKRTELVQATLQELTQALSQAHTVADVARCVFAAADRLWQWDSGVLDVLWPGTDLAETVWAVDVVDGERRELPPSPNSQSPPTPRLRKLMAGPELLLLAPGKLAPPGSVPFGDAARPSASLMGVPIRHRGQAIGALSLQSYTHDAFTAAGLTTLQSLADRCASALESIRAEEALRRDEARFRTLAEVLQFRGETTQDLLDFALQEAITLTGSQFGYLYQKSPAGPARYVLHTWATALKTSDGSRPHPELSAELDPASPAGAALRQREPVCVNDPPSQSAKSEVQSPKCEERGHSCPLGGADVPPSGQECPRSGENGAPASGPASPPHGDASGAGSFFRHLAVPVISGGAVVAVVGVVNKGSRYDAGDTHQLRLLMEAVWKVIEQRQALADLRESEDRFRTLVETAPEAIFIQTGGCFAYVNDAARRLFGVADAAGLIGQPVLSQFDPQYHAEVRTQIELTDLPSSILHPPASSLDPLSPLANAEEVCLRLAGPERDLYVSAVRFTYQGRPGALVFARDITERKRAEAALRESELRFRTLLQHVPAVAVQSYGPDGTTRYWNDASERLYGYRADEALGRNLLDLIIPEAMHAGVRQAMQQMAATGQAIPPGELVLRRKDGSPVLVFSSHALVQVPGQPPELFCLDLDLTERQRAEAALRQTQNDLQHAQAVSHTGSWQFEVLANVIQWSDETYRIFEIPLGLPMTHELFLARVHPEDRALLNPIPPAVRHGAAFEFRIVVDDRVKWVREHAELEFDDDGALLRAFGTVQDVTERKRAEEELRQSEMKFSLAFQTSPYAILITRLAGGQIMEANDAFETMSGFARAEALGQTGIALGLWVNPAEREQMAEDLRQGRPSVAREAQFRTKTGAIITGLCSARSFQLNGELCILSSISDITEHKRAELIRETLHTLARLLGVASTPVEAARSVFAAADKFWHWDAGVLNVIWPGENLVETVLCLDVLAGERRETPIASFPLDEASPRMLRVMARGGELVLRTPEEMQASDSVPFGDATRLSASIMAVPIRQQGQTVGLLTLQSYTPKAFTHEDLATLQSLADHCGGALERIRAQAATQESLLRYELVLAGAAGGIWDWDVLHQRVHFSSGWKALRGYTDTEVSDRETEWRAGIHPEDAPRVIAAVQAHFAGQTEVFQEEYRVRHKDGSWRWVLDRGKAVRDAAGQVIRMAGSELDITERKRLEAALQQRLVALTRPLDQAEGITFEELFEVPALQRLQDEFAAATGVASIITRPDGTPITQPSNFCRLCQDVIRCTEAGRRNCYHSDAVLGRYHPDGPIIQTCLSGGLWDAGASISVGDRHLANWLIGQVRDETQSDETIRAYAREIGADETEAVAAFREVPAMSSAQFQQIAQALFTMAKQLSTSAYQNVQQARFIADRQQAEAALRESEAKHAKMVANIGDVIAVIDQAGINRYKSPNVERWFGWRPDELVGVSTWDNVHPEDLAAAQKFIGALLDQPNAVGTTECRYRCKDGSYKWIEFTGTNLLHDPDIQGVLGNYHDITARRLTETALRASEERFRSYFELPIHGIAITSPDKGWLQVNDRICGLLGYSRAELACLTWAELTHPEDLAADVEQFTRVLSGEIDTYAIEKRFIRKDGQALWSRLGVGCVRQPAGGVAYIVAVIEDITERRRAETALRASEAAALSNNALLRSIMESPQDTVIFALDTSYRYTAFTEAHRQTIKAIWGTEIAVGMNMLDAIPSSASREQAQRNFDRALQGHHFIQVEDYGDPALRRITYEDRYGPIRDPAGVVTGLTVFVTDITERKAAAAALQQSQRLLAQTEKLGQVGGWEIELATQKLVWTETVHQIHEVAPGYQPTVAEGIQFYTPASRPVIAQAVQRAIEQGEPFDVELELITARGNHRWVHSIGEVDRARGKVFGFFQDITERKQAEEALRRAEEKYRALFENALEGIYQTTPQGTFVAANPAVARILGYDAPEALMHDRPDIASHGYVDPQKREEFKRRIAAEGQIKGFEYEVYRRDGSMVWVSENARAIRDEQGQVVLYEGSFEDITERKQAEVELAEAKALLQTAMDCSPAGIAIADAPDGKLRYVNRAGLGIRGGTEAELVTGVDINQYVASWQILDLDGTPLPAAEVPLAWAIQKGEPCSREFIIRRAPGDERIVLANAAPVLDASGKVLAGIVVFMDITARKRAEAAQRLSEARFAEFMAHLPAAVFIKDVFGRLLFANRYFLDLPGGPGQTRADRLLGGGAQPMSEDDLRVMVGHPLVGEECVTELGGISRIFQTIKFAILVPEQPAMLGGIALDITERKEAEAALRASESRTRGFLEFAVDGILEGAPDGTIIEANACLCALVGMAREAVIGKSIGDLPFAPESVAQHPWRFDLLQRGEVVVRERKLIRPDGSTVVIEMRSKQMPNGNLQSIFHDITARKADAAALEASEERLRLAMAAANMGTWDRDLTSSALRWSETEERLMGFAPGTFPGTSAAFLALLHPDSEAVHLAAQQRVRTGDGVFHAELHFRCADGRERWGLLSGQKILDASGQAVRIIGVDMDITERKRLEAEHATLEGQMRHAERLKSIGTLASGVAHEINNPINGVLNYAQMLLDQAEPGSRPAEFAAVILRESKRVIAIVRSLLQYSRQEPQPFSRVPVGELVEQSLSLLRTALRQDQIDLRVNVPADLPWLCCRGNQLQQVLVNLLTNARDALNQKYPGHDADKVLLLSAHTFQQADQPWLRFTVEDHGPGIPAALAERIFDPFFTTKQVDRGTGLGLSISHNLVQEHHGKLWVETEPGHWTRFHVDLPQEQTRKA